ncbi:MAG: MgtC/SapB family protein [Patescibacteria group bacterium]|nr:MgtC/SapB family protein [Patescibacteria group bacterium]
MDINTSEIFLRLILAVFLGGLIGLERQIAHKTAGLRTFSLISLSSALLTVVSHLLGEQYGANFNVAILPTQIISGIGFIGAGIIIFHGLQPKGITTAAGLIVSATVGIAVGFGFYSIAVFTTLLTLLIFTIMWFFEVKFISKIK